MHHCDSFAMIVNIKHLNLDSMKEVRREGDECFLADLELCTPAHWICWGILVEASG